MAPRLSATESMSCMPLEAYVAATSNSTLLGKPFTAAQVDLFSENEKPGRTAEICGKSPMNTGVSSTTYAPLGLIVAIGRLNSTLSV